MKDIIKISFYKLFSLNMFEMNSFKITGSISTVEMNNIISTGIFVYIYILSADADFRPIFISLPCLLQYNAIYMPIIIHA